MRKQVVVAVVALAALMPMTATADWRDSKDCEFGAEICAALLADAALGFFTANPTLPKPKAMPYGVKLYSWDGIYLGRLTNEFDYESITNDFGYGSEYRLNSVNNSYGRYGSRYSNESAANPIATRPPIVVPANFNWADALSAKFEGQATPYSQGTPPASPVWPPVEREVTSQPKPELTFEEQMKREQARRELKRKLQAEGKAGGTQIAPGSDTTTSVPARTQDEDKPTKSKACPFWRKSCWK